MERCDADKVRRVKLCSTSLNLTVIDRSILDLNVYECEIHIYHLALVSYYQMHNNVVPIAVGAALAVLVVIVLILYLVGRRKHQRGYETV